MAGIFRETNSVKWPVKVLIPKGDGTKRCDAEQFTITVNMIPADERDELSAMLKKDSTQDEIAEFHRKKLDMEVNNIVGWDISNLDFSPPNLEKVMNSTFYRKGISEAFWGAQNGGEQKN